MEPFTITLSAVSLVKEFVDLAEKLHDSFQKVSRNKQVNDRLSASTLKSARRLERFYLEHSETFNTARDLNDAMVELKEELESVYEKTQAFISIPSDGRLSKVKPIFKAWLDRNKIEGELSELNDRIQECHTNFCTFAVLRSNLNTHQILASTSRLEASTVTMKHDLMFLKQSNRTAGYHCGTGSIITPQVTGKRQTWTGIANHPVCQSPDLADLLSQVSDHILAEVFLRSKVCTIDRSLTKLARPQNFPIECPIDYFLRPFRPVFFVHNAEQRDSFRNDAIIRAISISDVLQKNHMSFSIQEGAIELLKLARMLRELGMFRDAVTIGIWAADLLRDMVNAGPVVYQPHFCLALLNLASSHFLAGNLADATQTAMASLEFHRQLIVFDTPEMECELAYCLVLSARFARENQEYDKAFKHATEAVAIYQRIHEVPEDKCLKITLEIEDETIMLDDKMNASDSGPCHKGASSFEFEGQRRRFVEYVLALTQMAWACYDIKQYREALDAGRKALKVVCRLWTTLPGNFLRLLAEISYFLSQATLRPIIAVDEALFYAIQSANLYRTLCGDSKAFNPHYYNSLWQCAAILESLGQHDEALDRAQEMARVAKEVMEDPYLLAAALEQISRQLRLLKRQDEAESFQNQAVQTYRIVHKATSEHEGAALYQLLQTLEGAGWYREAILAGQEAILYYRILATNGDLDHIKGLIDAQIVLARCLTAAKEFEQALNEGHEGLRLLEAVIDHEPSLLPTYLWGLQVTCVAALSDDATHASKSMERSQDVIRQFRKLFATYPTETVEGLPVLFCVHQNALLRCNKTREALKWLEEVEQWYQKYPLPMPSNLMASYLSALLSHGDLLMKLGQTHKGLEVTVRMIELCQSFLPEVEHGISTLYVGWNNRTEMLVYLGKYQEALESTIGPISNARKNPSEDTRLLAGPLMLASYASSRVGEHQAALHLAEEAVQICREEPMESQSDANMYDSIWSLWRLGEAHADMGDNARSFDLAMEAYQLAVAKQPSELYWGDLHHASTLSQFLLAVQLFAIGNFENALRHLEVLVEGQKDNVKFRPGYYPLYMNALHTLAWCYCALGRHDEGVIRYSELRRLEKMQELVNPDIAALVRVELEAEAKRPSRTALWQKIDLRCGHQHFGGPGAAVD